MRLSPGFLQSLRDLSPEGEPGASPGIHGENREMGECSLVSF